MGKKTICPSTVFLVDPGCLIVACHQQFFGQELYDNGFQEITGLDISDVWKPKVSEPENLPNGLDWVGWN